MLGLFFVAFLVSFFSDFLREAKLNLNVHFLPAVEKRRPGKKLNTKTLESLKKKKETSANEIGARNKIQLFFFASTSSMSFVCVLQFNFRFVSVNFHRRVLEFLCFFFLQSKQNRIVLGSGVCCFDYCDSTH